MNDSPVPKPRDYIVWEVQARLNRALDARVRRRAQELGVPLTQAAEAIIRELDER